MKNRKITTLLLAVLLISAFSGRAYAAFPDNPMTAEEMTRHNDAWGFTHKDGVVLALCGGGTKGLAHVGVFEVLKREHIPVAAIVGTSMGAIMGGLFATGWTPEEVRETVPKLNLMEVISGRQDKSLASESTSYQPKNNERLFNLNITGKGEVLGKKALLSSKDLYQLLQELTSRVSETDFDRFPTPFAAVATDLQSGESVTLRSGNLASALRASMSLPAIFEPWERDGRLLVDGGLKANLPVLLAKKMFPGHPVVAVNLSPMSIEGKSGKLDSMFAIAAQSLEILMHDQIIENCKAADLVIQVDCKGLGTLDSGGYDKIMDRGVAAAEEKIDELKTLVDSYHRYVPVAMHSGPEPSKQLIVGELVVAGVPQNIAKTFQERYRGWIGEPLDMKDISAAVKEMSARSEIKSVEPKIDNISRDIVRVTLDVQQPPKVELSLSGYSSNLNSDRWLSVAALSHNLLLDGDTADLELRGGTNWGIMGRYFTPLTRNNWQLGLSASLVTEDNFFGSKNDNGYVIVDGKTYSFVNRDSEKFKRFSGKAMIYKNLAKDKIRLGAGYAVGHTDYDYNLTFVWDDRRETFSDKDETLRGIAASIGINSLDDPVVPTKGFALMSDIWFPHGKDIFSRTEFTAKIPLKSNWLISLTGGLHTAAYGLQTDGFMPPYYALLGTRNELWTLASEPLFGEQAYWGKIAASKVLMKSWWGGINTEFFVAGGRTSENWNETAYTAWEAGIQFSIPTNFLPGSFIVAYGQSRAHGALFEHYRPDRNEFVIGYTLGIPKWWKGPLP